MSGARQTSAVPTALTICWAAFPRPEGRGFHLSRPAAAEVRDASHVSVGPNTALAFVLTLGDVSRFRRGKQVASYLGLIPSERSSSQRRRLGSISKQGNPFVRMLLVESVQTVNRLDEGFRKQYQHRCHRKAKGVAKVAAARRLAVRLYWMLRSNTPYPEIARIESSSRNGVVVRHGG